LKKAGAYKLKVQKTIIQILQISQGKTGEGIWGLLSQSFIVHAFQNH
jgi:hypothetical protein